MMTRTIETQLAQLRRRQRGLALVWGGGAGWLWWQPVSRWRV